jgi:ubiquinone/menaquinone biosynthesis C-methylase UbiE
MNSTDDGPITGSPAEIYEQHLVPAVFGPWTTALVELVSPAPGNAALDVGCGTGAMTRKLADCVGPSGRVVGLDYDTGMIEVAQALRADIKWHVADAQDMPFSDDEFDLVTCHEGLQFFPDRVASLKEMRRVMRPAGRLGLAVWRSSDLCPGYNALGQAMGKWVSPEMATLPPFSLSDADELHTLVRAAGFEVISVEPIKQISLFSSANRFTEMVVAGASAKTRDALAQVAPGDKAAFMRDVEEMLATYVTERGLELPMEAHFVSALSPK